VCNMRPTPAYNTELISQALMGTPVRILEDRSGWAYIRTPDSYEGWVSLQSIVKMEGPDFEEWKGSVRLLYLEKYGDVLVDTLSGEILSDIVAGTIIRHYETKGNYSMVFLPDGRPAYIDRDKAIVFDRWLEEEGLKEEKLKEIAKSFKGLPYLWGGTSSKAFDCSGFTRTVYYLNGIILERDASRQFRHGIKLGKEAYPDSLNTGDLLFFGHVREGISTPTHVGMYIGDTEFIHASGTVKINSLDSSRGNFSRSRRDAFLGVRRIIGAEPGEGIQPVSSHPWYK